MQCEMRSYALSNILSYSLTGSVLGQGCDEHYNKSAER